MPQSLLSERTVARWVRAGGNQHQVAGQREQALYDRLKTTLGQETAFELEDVVVGWIEAEQARVLTYVGTDWYRDPPLPERHLMALWRAASLSRHRGEWPDFNRTSRSTSSRRATAPWPR